MADKGIIFSAPMVRALLDGGKTQTRRLVKKAPHGAGWHCDRADTPSGYRFVGEGGAPSLPCVLPYAPGDRLYVREAFTIRGVYSDVGEVGYRAHERASHTEFVEQWPVERANNADGKRPRVTWPAYKPSIHMPRWASRLTLLVTDVRVQRVAEISETDALADGAQPIAIMPNGPEGNPSDTWLSYRAGFEKLWNSLHDKPGERWEGSPWVVAVSFDVKHGNIDAVSM